MKVQSTNYKISRVILYAVLIVFAFLMLVPFAWMVSASLKLDKDVFIFPIQWIPENPRWKNYIDIWTKIPLMKFVVNTVKITLIVTCLQLLTSSFAAYAFAKLNFKHKNGLFLAYIATIAVPWQVYMVPQFMMMRSFGLNDTHLAIICLQAFSAFGVFMMRQFYQGIPDELCEAARIDGASRVRIFFKITLPMITSIAFFNIIMQLITALQNFTSAFVVTNGGPNKATYVLGMKLYTDAFKYFKMGYACATSWILFVIIMIMTLILFATSKKWVYYDN